MSESALQWLEKLGLRGLRFFKHKGEVLQTRTQPMILNDDFLMPQSLAVHVWGGHRT